MPHRRTHQAATQRATPIVGPRSQGRPSPYSPGVRAAIAGSAGRPRKDLPPRGFRDQPLPRQATGGRFGSIDETMPQPSPRFRPDLKEFFQTIFSRPMYPSPPGNQFGAPAEDPGLYNLYRMMMGRRRRNPIGQRPYRPEPVRPQIMPEYRVDPRIDPYPTG
jgi:hypothetical protein